MLICRWVTLLARSNGSARWMLYSLSLFLRLSLFVWAWIIDHSWLPEIGCSMSFPTSAQIHQKRWFQMSLQAGKRLGWCVCFIPVGWMRIRENRSCLCKGRWPFQAIIRCVTRYRKYSALPDIWLAVGNEWRVEGAPVAVKERLSVPLSWCEKCKSGIFCDDRDSLSLMFRQLRPVGNEACL